MKSKSIVTLSLLCLLLSPALSGCGGVPRDPTFIANRSGVLFYGDSIFGSWDLDSYFPGKGYINGGYFGQRTDQLLARLPDALSGKNVCSGFDGAGDPTQATLTCGPIPPPATVVILAGWNNMFQGYQVDARPDIDKMVALSLRAGARVVLCTVYRFDPAHPASWMVPTGNAPVNFYDMWRDPLNDLIRSIRGQEISTVDLSNAFSQESDYTVDGVHPNALGFTQMHDAIAPALN